MALSSDVFITCRILLQTNTGTDESRKDKDRNMEKLASVFIPGTSSFFVDGIVEIAFGVVLLVHVP